MKRLNPEGVSHSKLNESVLSLFESVPGITINVKLDDALAKRGMTQQHLALLTGLRGATISEFVHGNKAALNKVHLMAIMVVLRITDITEIFDISFNPETVAQFKEESKNWIENKVIPEGIVSLCKDRVHHAIDFDIKA